ncbi:MAG: hypothetical protein ACOX9C_13065 [Kiritimatiellia bacterium]|jgi:hypothetical protein
MVKLKTTHRYALLTLLTGLIVIGSVVMTHPDKVTIKLVDEPNFIEVNAVRQTFAEAAAFLDKANCHRLRHVELIGFERSTVRQMSRAYGLLSERGYRDKVTFIFSDQKIPAWIYPMEDHHHRLADDRVVDILIDGEGFRFGGANATRQTRGRPGSKEPRRIEGESRVRIYDSDVYDDPDKLLAATNLDNVPKDTPIEIMCEDSLPGLLPLQMMKAVHLLGFENIYVAFF